jgi:23S rRNA (cytidine2498-2'-O)-methyltransferase
VKPANLLLYCRPGFERECAQEITRAASEMGASGFVRARPEGGFALFVADDPARGAEFGEHIVFERLVFPRQLVRTGERLEGLAAGDRLGPIVATARDLGRRFAALWIEMPDTNEGKALSALARSLRPHLEKALAAAGIAVDAPKAAERLHVFFVDGASCHVGTSRIDNGSAWPMGIARIRMPGGSPSRSTLKLAEALMEFVPGKERSRRLQPGMTAVDLGAAPGGWTWQLVQKGLMVTAVDNGSLDPALLESGQVKHRREDAFGFRPAQPVDWMVCDMIESPARVARLAARWIAEGWCREAIFNLKLPMKKRFEEVLRCEALIDEALGGGGYFLRVKHLSHDREEVTAHLSRR